MNRSDELILARAHVVVVARRLVAGIATLADLEAALERLNAAERASAFGATAA